MKCPCCGKEIKYVRYCGIDKNGELYLKGKCFLKGNKTDVLKFSETPAIRSNSEYFCPECKKSITNFLAMR